jgi:predicted RNA-binding protein with PIN domain
VAFILIDGYNLIGVAHKDLEKARSGLIEKLSRYSGLKGHEVTVVFDGWKNGQAVESRLKTGGITVIFSRIGENADSVIKRILKESKRSWIVVSSDREVSDFAFRRDSVSVTSDEFEEKLYSALGGTDLEDLGEFSGYEDEDDVLIRPKGRSRTPSRKLKKKLRALERL